MQKRIINHHKIKRQIKRNAKKSKSFVAILLGLAKKKDSRRDFSWQGRHHNPYTHKEEKDHTLRNIIILTVCILTMLGIGVYHSYFKINSIEVFGLQRIENQELKETVHGILDYRTLGIIPHNSYFLTDIDEVRDILKERFPISSIVVEKKFPNNLKLTIEEKISTLIYDNGEDYSYMDMEGNIVEKVMNVGDHEWNIVKNITTSTNERGDIETHEEIVEKTHKPNIQMVIDELGNYPIVYDKRKKETTRISI